MNREVPNTRGAPTPSAAAGFDVVGDDPGARGRLTIAPRVVERVAQRAVSEVDSATGSATRVLGIALGSGGDRARVSATVHADAADVTVEMSVTWPASVRGVTEQVRSRVVSQLRDLVGIQHAHVAIRVTALVTDEPEQRRVI
ncbi:MAG: alkaline shock response membrane anchor protein AmaP [Actinomycetota bacterium]|nr:alkaline shock response membrane anchor protein AmaP [Actinomycetota bacterium]